MYISPDTIDAVRDRVIIQDIIKRYVPSLAKKGKNYIGLCPFHREKTPSFTVSPDKQIFYCFGCHTGGNVFSFISKIEKLSFQESVKHIASIVGVEIKDGGRGSTKHLDSARRLNQEAMELYHNCLKTSTGRVGSEYLQKRGISQKSIDQFKIGFAPDSWDYLIKNVIKSKDDFIIAEKFGLINSTVKNNQRRYYDRFRKRVIFPIFDNSSRAIAFGGRIIEEDHPKYLNSPESEIFKKRNVLYGFNFASDSIQDLNRAIVVEGYFDVIGCHQMGISNVVAPLGTALTPEQLKFLAQYCNEIILIFDADSAGLKAAHRSLDIADELHINLKVGMLPEADPFDYVMKKGMREFMVVVDSAINPVDFRISQIMKNLDNMGRVNTLLQIFSVIADIQYETERSAYIKKISTLLGVDENSVRTDFMNYISRGKKPVKHLAAPARENGKGDFITRSYRDMLKLLCNYPELIEKAVIDYNESDIPDEVPRNIFRKISELYYSDIPFSIDKIFDFFPDGREMDFLNESVNSDYSVTNPNSAYTEIYINMKLHEIDSKIDKFAGLIKSSPQGSYHEYITEIEVLRREKEKLAQYIYNKFM